MDLSCVFIIPISSSYGTFLLPCCQFSLYGVLQKSTQLHNMCVEGSIVPSDYWLSQSLPLFRHWRRSRTHLRSHISQFFVYHSPDTFNRGQSVGCINHRFVPVTYICEEMQWCTRKANSYQSRKKPFSLQPHWHILCRQHISALSLWTFSISPTPSILTLLLLLFCTHSGSKAICEFCFLFRHPKELSITVS